MARIVVIGAGVVGLTTSMLLAKDGHEVVVLERDGAAPGRSADVWETWERRGVNQFRLPHAILARYRQILESELPEVLVELEGAGALRYNVVRSIPEELRGPERAGDSDFELVTARRPVFEWALARRAGDFEGLELRRGVGVESIALEDGGGIPRVTGVRTSGGDVVADLVVDASGRRSAVPRMLGESGAPPPHEELDDSGFMYLARHLRSADGSVPFAFGPPLQHLGTITSLTLAADNGTWGLVLVINASDRALLGLRDPGRWERAWRSLPLVAHWLEGTPIDDGVTTMSKIEDRIRTYVVDGAPVVTGLVAVGDAWACSNPTHGRGVSVGGLQGVALRDTLRTVGAADPHALSLAFHEATETQVRPWFEWTRREDRHRLAEVDAQIAGRDYEPDDPAYELEQSLSAASGRDPDLLRIGIRAQMVLQRLEDSLADPELKKRALELGRDWRTSEVPAPSRDELVAIARG